MTLATIQMSIYSMKIWKSNNQNPLKSLNRIINTSEHPKVRNLNNQKCLNPKIGNLIYKNLNARKSKKPKI